MAWRILAVHTVGMASALGHPADFHYVEPTEVGRSEISVEIPEETRDSVTLEVTKDRALHIIKLQRHSCRGENFRVLATDGRGGFDEMEAPPVCTYSGIVVGDPGSEVLGAITEAGARLRVRCSDGTCWQIEPPSGPGESHSSREISVREQLEELSHLADAAMTPEFFMGALALPRSVTVKQAEIGFDIDYPTWSRSGSGGFNRSDAAAVAKMEEFVAVKLNSFVISNALVEHVVGTIVIRKSPAEDPYDGMTDGYAILPHMRNVWNGTGNTGFPRPSTTHDLATGLIGRGIGVAGLGYVGTINETSRYTIGTTTSGSGVGFWFNGVCKHEVAHNWGLGHGGCGDEKRPISNPDDFTWSMCGGWHERMRSDEASRVISERDSSNLVDIGPYTASSQAPYCPKDTATVSIGGAPVLLDVQRNDYDANNDPFQLERVKLHTGVSATVGQTATTELGGTMAISQGSGPGGRDQVLYTPPATGTPGSVDRFWYDVRDSTGRGNFGQVKVTLQPSSQPKEVNPGLFLADTAIDFSNEDNPVRRQLDVEGGGGDVFVDVWSYGSFDGGSPTFTLATGHQIDAANVIGDENDGWIGSNAVRIHKHAMLPSDGNDSVKRWTSFHDGEVAVIYDAKRLDTGGNGVLPSIRHNGATVWSDTLNDGDPHATGTVFFEVATGDTVDFVVDSLGSRTGDWLHFTGRIVKAEQVSWRTFGGPTIHYRFDAAGTFPPERKRVAADYSGNKHHAALVGFDVNNARFASQVENGLIFDGSNDEIITPEPVSLQGATELTLALWARPDTLGDNRGMITSLNDADLNASYFGLLVGPAANGNPAQFRAHRNFINAPGGSLPVGRWTHLVGVWRSGAVQKLYVNGVEAAEDTTPPSSSIDTDHWVTGRDRDIAGRWFDGGIDDVAIWERALDAAEVAAIYVQSRYSRAYDGSSHFEQSSSPLYANGSTEITMAAWVRADSLGDNRGIITSYNGPDFDGDPFERSYFALLIGDEDDGRPAQFRAHRYLVNALPGSFPVGEWAHIVGVWRAGVEQSLYIDGVRVANDPDPANKPIDIDAWITGRDRLNAGRFFDGEISEPLIMDRAMDADEVAGLFAVGRTNHPATEGIFTFGGQIGSQTGTYEEASGIHTTSTRGNVISGTSDSFVFASRAHRGDGEVQVRLESLNDTGSGAKQGLMFRDGRAASAPFVMLWQYGDGRIAMRYRATAGANHVTHITQAHVLTFPLWLRLSRSGDTFQGATSVDGEDWTPLPSATVNLSETLQVGIAHQSGTTSIRSIAAFGGFSLRGEVSFVVFDGDGDGLNDSWEMAQFGDLSQSGDDDPDRDGIVHLFERFHGTHPTQPDARALHPTLANITGNLVAHDSVWMYLDDGSNQGTAWRLPGFDHSGWASGPGPLGYNEPDIATTVDFGGNPLARHVTTYFRHRFYVHDPSLLSSPSLLVRRDDGVAVYLNGIETGRDNLPAVFTYQTLADDSVSGGEETTPVAFPVQTGDLQVGWNTFAAEVHQGAPGSSDLAFSLELAAQLGGGLGAGEYLVVRFERAVAAASEFVVTAEASSDLEQWTPVDATIRVVADNGETETVEVIDDQPFVPGQPRNLRVRLTSP